MILSFFRIKYKYLTTLVPPFSPFLFFVSLSLSLSRSLFFHHLSNFTVGKVDLETTDGRAHFTERGMVALTINGIVNKQIADGNIRYQMFEQGVKSKVDSGAFAYFKCTNKGCDPSQPMYLTLADPKDQLGTKFVASFPLQLPYQQTTGQMTVSVIGTDETHLSDFTLGVSFNYTNTKEDGASIVGQVQQIQATLLDSLKEAAVEKEDKKMVDQKMVEDKRVQGGGKTECVNDVDCPSSYCMVKKSPPFFCHDCGMNCCNSDADCAGSYCMDDPSKKIPFSCHSSA